MSVATAFCSRHVDGCAYKRFASVSHTVPETISAATHNGNMAAAAIMYVATILFTLFIVFGGMIVTGSDF